MENIQDLYRELDDIAAKKANVEDKLMAAIQAVIQEEAKNNPHKIKNMGSNIHILRASELISSPTWSLSYFSYDRAADIVSKFIEKCGVAECKAKLEELLAKSNGKTVNFKQLPHKSDWEGRYNEVVDADFIRKILERI